VRALIRERGAAERWIQLDTFATKAEAKA